MKKQDDQHFIISNRIRELICSTGLSFSTFSKVTGIPYSTLEGWVNGDPNIKVESIRRFCETMGLDESRFFQKNFTDLDFFRAGCGFWAARMTVVEREQALDWIKILVTSRR